MIIAMPAAPHPTTREPTLTMSKDVRAVYERHGFLTYPQFLDTHYVFNSNPDIKWLVKNLNRFESNVRFAVSPDKMPEESKNLKQDYPDVNWIYPLHNRDEDISDFEWVGFPHRKELRDYDLKMFLKITKNKKRWYLGFFDSKQPKQILMFDGLDTQLPKFFASKLGSLWINWGKTISCGHLGIRSIELLEFNVISFKVAFRKLQDKQSKISLLSQFMDVS